MIFFLILAALTVEFPAIDINRSCHVRVSGIDLTEDRAKYESRCIIDESVAEGHLRQVWMQLQKFPQGPSGCIRSMGDAPS